MAACFYFIEERFMSELNVETKLRMLAKGHAVSGDLTRADYCVNLAIQLDCEKSKMADEIAELREENNKLKAMIDNGLGWEDMKGGTIQDVS